MNQQDKQLLLTDICSRLPNGVCISFKKEDVRKLTIDRYGDTVDIRTTVHRNGKPILFPISALTKEITIAGETFVPINRLMKTGIIDHLDWISNEREHWIKTRGFDNWLGEIPFKTIKHLIEWHIDYRGLIDKGLAVSVYSLDKNPYE